MCDHLKPATNNFPQLRQPSQKGVIDMHPPKVYPPPFHVAYAVGKRGFDRHGFDERGLDFYGNNHHGL